MLLLFPPPPPVEEGEGWESEVILPIKDERVVDMIDGAVLSRGWESDAGQSQVKKVSLAGEIPVETGDFQIR